MVTLAQINKFDSGITELAKMLEPPEPHRYHVELVWLQPDGSVLDSDGKPYVHQPGEVHLYFEDPSYGHSRPD